MTKEAEKIEITPELIAIMREQYGHRCRICGDLLSLQDSRDMVFACPTSEDDPDRPGHLRTKPGRSTVDDHYSKSRRYFSREHWQPDPVVMALLDAYEALLPKNEEKEKDPSVVCVEITFTGDGIDDAVDAVDRVLDNGTFQDALNEYAQDNDLDIEVESATVIW